MSVSFGSIPQVLAESPVRVEYGAGTLSSLGRIAAAEGLKRVLLVTDPGIVAAGHEQTARQSLLDAGIHVAVFDGTCENPTSNEVKQGLEVARRERIDGIIGLGGGSAMDCAKGINLLLTNGGDISDYWGEDKTTARMLPLIAIPTTAGTGSEAQSFALISDPVTHRKMACGDRRLPSEGGLRPRVAILDSNLTRTQPASVASAAGIDAIAHAVETAASRRRTAVSRQFSREAWARLNASCERALRDPGDTEARSGMLLGAHLAGAAIEFAMLGAAHACANPLTARYGIVHGRAVGTLLPHVIRFNVRRISDAYADLDADGLALAARIDQLLEAARIPHSLADYDVPREGLAELASLAAEQWTAGFNPVPVGKAELQAILESALNGSR